MTIKGKDVKVGDKLFFLHNEESRFATVIFCEVIKLGKKKIKVKDEFGNEGWKHTNFFDGTISQQRWNELFPQGRPNV